MLRSDLHAETKIREKEGAESVREQKVLDKSELRSWFLVVGVPVELIFYMGVKLASVWNVVMDGGYSTEVILLEVLVVLGFVGVAVWFDLMCWKLERWALWMHVIGSGWAILSNVWVIYENFLSAASEPVGLLWNAGYLAYLMTLIGCVRSLRKIKDRERLKGHKKALKEMGVENAEPPQKSTQANQGNQWYYADSGETRGPINAEEVGNLIASGKLQPDTPVWQKGMSEWRCAEETSLGKHFEDTTKYRPSPKRE